MCVQLGVLFPLVLAQSHQVCSWQGGWQGATSPFKCVFGFPVLAAELLGLSTISLLSVGLHISSRLCPPVPPFLYLPA